MYLADVKKQSPPPFPNDLKDSLRQINQQADRSIVVIDDDPTGCQTLFDIPLLLEWGIRDLIKQFKRKTPLFFILSNSRSLPESQAIQLLENIAGNLKTAAGKVQRKFTVVSRSDSTLRGHYPAEVFQLKKSLKLQTAKECIIPAFFPGGRYTIRDIHYVLDKKRLIPASKTVFAEDASFGYKQSDLKKWVEEKSKGKISWKSVFSFSTDDLRLKGPDYVEKCLLNQDVGKVIIVNALEQSDLDVFALGAIKAEQKGVPIIYRSGASFLNSYGAIPLQPLLRSYFKGIQKRTPGLIVVGSYVSKSTEQLNILLNNTPITPCEINVEAIEEGHWREEIERSVALIQHQFRSNLDVVLFTSRRIIHRDDPEDTLSFGQRIMEVIIEIIKMLTFPPAYLICKGGITSHEVARKGLNVKQATVVGQAMPGVPVWELDMQSRFPGIPYIVFPGNVGVKDSLLKLYNLFN
jgi:uncharacterized protein YgbK (DUF1537 family)